jgi:DNA-binding CsgD family transcriptional regulator
MIEGELHEDSSRYLHNAPLEYSVGACFRSLKGLVKQTDIVRQMIGKDTLLQKISAYEQFAYTSGTYYALLDTATLRYLYLGRNFPIPIGLNKRDLLEQGLSAWMEKLHPQDANALIAIHNWLYQLLPKVAIADRSSIRIAYNYRSEAKKGMYRHFFQHLTGQDFSEEGYPQVVLVVVSEITHLMAIPQQNCFVSYGGKEHDRAQMIDGRLVQLDKPVLSPREMLVLQIVTELGLTTEEAAKYMHISSKTLSTHRRNMLQKTGCRDLTALAAYARLIGWEYTQSVPTPTGL